MEGQSKPNGLHHLVVDAMPVLMKVYRTRLDAKPLKVNVGS